MVKTFRSVREVFRHYIPGYIEREEERERANRPGPYQTPKQSLYNTDFVDKLLEDFRLSLVG